MNPALEGLRNDLDSRPQTPTVVGLDKDEREEFLKRENELSDQLAERESALVAAKKLVEELKEELVFLKEQEGALSKVRSPLWIADTVADAVLFAFCRRTRRCLDNLMSCACRWND